MKFKKIILSVAVSLLLFTGCVEEKAPTYDLTIISPSFEKAYKFYSSDETEYVQYELLSSDRYTDVITEETLPLIESVTVVDDSITTETAQEITALCKAENIPVFFMMSDIDSRVLESYDKAYCITADYTYIGECFAEEINRIWTEELIDKNKDKIFTFSVIKTETLSPVYQAYYDRLIEYIELLGIPLQQLEEVFLTKGDVLSYCMDNQNKNEAFVILQSDYISAIAEGYEPYGDGVEILGIYFGVENKYAELPYTKICFIDYTEYFEARNAIMNNIDNHTYPFENFDYSVIGKTVYIEPVI